MTLPIIDQPVSSIDTELQHIIDSACARIAPAWPLDRMIAVNPYWGWRSQPIAEAAARIGALSGSSLVMSRDWFRRQWDRGRLGVGDVRYAAARHPEQINLVDVWDALRMDAEPLPKHPLVTDPRDLAHGNALQHTWSALAIDQIGRTCESYLDAGQSPWGVDRTRGLYAHWRVMARHDAAPRLLLGEAGVAEGVDDLPEHPLELIATALETLNLTREAREPYLTALLMDVGGWAATCAHRRWEARLAGTDDATIVELLAVRLAWELLLYRNATGTDLAVQWTHARRAWQPRAAAVLERQRIDWLLQRAVELRYHDGLARALAAVESPVPLRSGAAALAPIQAQAVFCIDVRSEVMRRAIEADDAGVVTLGFAGFFGLPLAYASLAGELRPQLPGLLAATVVAEDRGTARDGEAERVHAERSAQAQWARAKGSVPGTFGYVETTGLGAIFSLAEASFAPEETRGDIWRAGLDTPDAAARPELTRHADGSPLDIGARAALAAQALRGMSLTEGFARLVAFIGHGVRLPNNPQAAGLACGACGGQSGEVNARALAALLNDREVCAELGTQGIVIPDTTRFVGGVHDTCTDDIVLFPEPHLEATHADDLAELRAAFTRAGRRARAERAPRLGLDASDPRILADTLRARAADWSEVRPEWGLARNAAFIAAPRARTRALNLDGRAFLHEYEYRRDAGFAVLETIMTAPMVVANWINLQYYASTVDPVNYGSGDKVLHNVVGGTLGVYEGAGGDLRIGLARQSVHDGAEWVHEPLRLGVYIEAPAAAIDGIIAKHETVRELIEHEWLFLYRIDPHEGGVFARTRWGWMPVGAAEE